MSGIDEGPRDIDRRRMLVLLAATAGALTLPACVAPPSGGTGSDTYTNVTALGLAYLERRPAEASRAWLRSQLGDPPLGITPPALRTRLAAQILADVSSFPNLRMISIDGWLLSETECRAAALWAKRNDDD